MTPKGLASGGNRLVLAVVLSALVAGSMAGCNGLSAGRFDVNVVTQAEPLETLAPASTLVIAQCGTGDQVLGGGYDVYPGPYQAETDVSVGAGPYQTTVHVEASYPYVNPHIAGAGPSGWAVEVENPDTGRFGSNWDSIVFAEAYCVATRNFPLDPMVASRTYDIPDYEQLVAQGLSQFPSAPWLELTQDMEVSCPQGRATTAGGFSTEVPAGGYNASVTRSWPLLDGSGDAVGWHVQQWPVGAPAFTTTVYALCVQSLDPVAASSEVVPTFPPPPPGALAGAFEHSLACPPGEFSAGGGFEIPNDQLHEEDTGALVPGYPTEEYPSLAPFGSFQMFHWVTDSRTMPALAGWAIGGFGVGTDRNSPAHGAYGQRTTYATAWALCARPPEALLGPTITIFLPSPGDTFPVPAGATQTGQVEFVADAKDATGAVIRDNITWTDNGSSIAQTGAVIRIPLAGTSGTLTPHLLTATATDSSGRSASASVMVFAGGLAPTHPPTVAILQPRQGFVFPVPRGADRTGPIRFQALATAVPSGIPITGAALAWTDSVDGPLGQGEAISAALTGTPCVLTSHVVTVTATDPGGAQASSSVTVFTGSAPTDPSCV